MSAGEASRYPGYSGSVFSNGRTRLWRAVGRVANGMVREALEGARRAIALGVVEE